MPTGLDWTDIAGRLLLTLGAGTLIGINRWERGRAAGLRTTLLVCLAASLSMIQANLLLGTTGKAANSFVQIDVMRLPLGILSGIGFIGGGVILRRGNMIVGITTAATLWFATVIGLCLGGGQLGIGIAGTALGLMVLWCFRYIEKRLKQQRTGTLTLTVDDESRIEEEMHAALKGVGFHIVSLKIRNAPGSRKKRVTCEVNWTASPQDVGLPTFVRQLSEYENIRIVAWSETVRPES